ncbi:unnamed protein product, partial [Rotaria sp. Silwood2]
MTKSFELLVNFLDAIDIENLKEAIEAITIIIDRYKNPITEKDKKILIRCLKCRVQANFEDKNYKAKLKFSLDTLTDLEQLMNLGFNVRDNEILNSIL